MRSKSVIIAALVAALLVGSVTPSHAQDAPPDPALAAADAARRAAEQDGRPHFEPGLYGSLGGCVNEPPEDQRVASTMVAGFSPPAPNARPMNGSPMAWQVSAPRGYQDPARPGGSAEVGLRDKFGRGSRLVYVDVFRPDGTAARNGAALVGDGWATLTYPSQFRAGEPLVPGVYTIVWRDTITDRFIACDGFVVEP
jgi:hypothetical protein